MSVAERFTSLVRVVVLLCGGWDERKRSSLVEKTGSAMTATVLAAGERPLSSRRNTARVEAEGRVTISCCTSRGVKPNPPAPFP
jgi:hypothetical protein